jgi:hypothetical protein
MGSLPWKPLQWRQRRDRMTRRSPSRRASRFKLERHEFDEGFGIGGDITADAHFAELWIGEFERPAGLTRDFGDRFVPCLAVESQHVVAPGNGQSKAQSL